MFEGIFRRKEERPEIKRIQLDQDRHFVIGVFPGGRTEVLLEKNGAGPIINFQDFLPPKYQFLIGRGWWSDPLMRRVRVGPWNSEHPARSALCLLHEIGHTRNVQNQARLFQAAYQYNRSLIDRRMDQKSKEGAARDLEEAVLSSEKDAWEWTLQKVEEIKTQTGVDILKDFSNRDELEKYINDFLDGNKTLVENVIAHQELYAGLFTPGVKKYNAPSHAFR